VTRYLPHIALFLIGAAVAALILYPRARAADERAQAAMLKSIETMQWADRRTAELDTALARQDRHHAEEAARLREIADTAQRQRTEAQRASQQATATAQDLRQRYEEAPTLATCHDALTGCQAEAVALRQEVAAHQAEADAERDRADASAGHVLILRHHVTERIAAYDTLRVAYAGAWEAFDLQAQATARERQRAERYRTFALIAGGVAVTSIILHATR
jgi:hypothetical protein